LTARFVAPTHQNSARIALQEALDLQQAIIQLEDIFKVLDRAAIPDLRGEGSALCNLGLAYADLGQAEKAIGLLEQVLQIGQEIKDPNIVRVVSTTPTLLGRPPGPS